MNDFGHLAGVGHSSGTMFGMMGSPGDSSIVDATVETPQGADAVMLILMMTTATGTATMNTPAARANHPIGVRGPRKRN